MDCIYWTITRHVTGGITLTPVNVWFWAFRENPMSKTRVDRNSQGVQYLICYGLQNMTGNTVNIRVIGVHEIPMNVKK